MTYLVISRIVMVALIVAGAAGCGGTFVPDVQELPGQPGGDALLVKAIVDSIHCEIKNSVQAVIGQDYALAKEHPPQTRTAPWLDNWGIGGLLTLTILERSATNPSVTYTPDPLSKILFSLMGDINLSVQATRVDTTNFFYLIRDLAYKEKPCQVIDGSYTDVGPHPVGSLLINSDLKIQDWLAAKVLLVGTGAAQLPLQKDALTYKIDFEVITSADINPIWKLTRVAVNASGTLLSGKRDRTHSLSLTFGPADEKTKTLTGVAADQFFAEQIGTSINTRLQNLLP